MKYTIKKGKHFANFKLSRLFPFTSKRVSGICKFSASCLTQGDISGWNKLTGITSLRIHKNSGRLVWQSNGSKIRIAGYVYKNGERKEIEITTVDVDTPYIYSVTYKRGFWHFVIRGKEVVMGGKLGWLRILCLPYFGGRSKAPVKMEVWI